MPGAKRACRPSRQWSPSTASMITTGSVRGKCCALHCGQSRRQPPCETLVGAAAIGAEAMARMPVQQRLGFRERGQMLGRDQSLHRDRAQIGDEKFARALSALSATSGSSPSPNRPASPCSPRNSALGIVVASARTSEDENIGIEPVAGLFQHDPFAADDIMQAGLRLPQRRESASRRRAFPPRVRAANWHRPRCGFGPRSMARDIVGRITGFAGRHPELVLHRIHEAVKLLGVMRQRRHRAPDRLRPRRVGLAARDHVHVQLRHRVAERRDIELVALGHRPSARATRARSRSSIAPALDLVEIDDFHDAGPARHQQQPGIIRVLDDQDARQRQVADRMVSRSSCGCSDQAGDDIHVNTQCDRRLFTLARPAAGCACFRRSLARYRHGRLAVDEPLANRVRSGRKQP